MSKSIKSSKPSKPSPKFPLTPNGNGQWSKKVKGRVFYFGPWDDPQGALENYRENIDHINLYGCKKSDVIGDTVADLCNAFMAYKESQHKAGEIKDKTFTDYLSACTRIVEAFGKERPVEHLKPDDFRALRDKLTQLDDGSGKRSLVSLANIINHIRVVMKFGSDEGHFEKPLSQIMGRAFSKPSRKTLVRERRGKPKKLFSARQIQTLLNHESATVQMKAMILLGINGGFGNEDLATLPISSIDLETGWIEHARPKTDVERRTPLWAETIDAIEEVLASRKMPKDERYADLLFITKYGKGWSGKGSSNPMLSSNRSARLRTSSPTTEMSPWVT